MGCCVRQETSKILAYSSKSNPFFRNKQIETINTLTAKITPLKSQYDTCQQERQKENQVFKTQLDEKSKNIEKLTAEVVSSLLKPAMKSRKL